MTNTDGILRSFKRLSRLEAYLKPSTKTVIFEEHDVEIPMSSNPHDETIIQRRGQGNGRPALLKTGKPDRSRKVYQPGETPHPDPKPSREIMMRDDAEQQ